MVTNYRRKHRPEPEEAEGSPNNTCNPIYIAGTIRKLQNKMEFYR